MLSPFRTTTQPQGYSSSEAARDVSLRAGVGRRSKQLRCLGVLDQSSIQHECCKVTGPRRLLHVVRHDRHRAAVFQVKHQLLDFRRCHRIERRARLVEQQDLGIDGESARDTKPLLLASGKRECRFVQGSLASSHNAAGASCARPDRLAALVAIDSQPVSHVFENRFRKWIRPLKNHADSPPQPHNIHLRDVLPSRRISPTTRVLRIVSFIRFSVRRKVDFPQAGWTDQCRHAVLGNFQVQSEDGLLRTIEKFRSEISKRTCASFSDAVGGFRS